MNGAFKRRNILAGGLAAGAGLLLAGRAFAQTPDSPLTLGKAAGTVPPSPSTITQPSVPPVAATIGPDYQKRIFEAARREVSRAGNALWRTDLVGVADFGMPSAFPRLHFANMENGTIRSFLVAHGRGSDREHDGWLKTFSNVPGSEATSRGAYLTCEWYSGKYGTSIRLKGLDGDNSSALDRAIVMHPATYVGPAMIERWGKIGRSEGCFAMAPNDFNEALWHLSGGRLLFADKIGLG